jgi:hypothetical protein
MTFMVFDCLKNQMIQSGMSEMDAEALAISKGGNRVGYYVFEDGVNPLPVKPVQVNPVPQLGFLF